MILSDEEKRRLVESLSWMIESMKHKSDENKGDVEEGSQGDYSPELKEAMSLLEDVEKTETSETTGYHRKSVAVNCREFDCDLNRQGTCALSKTTLERVGSLIIGTLKCVQAVQSSPEEEAVQLSPEEENQKHTKPCPYDGSIKCVQYPEDGCGCDPCSECGIKLKLLKVKGAE